MKAIDWFLTVAGALNDNEPNRPFQRYSLKDMMAAYNAAMCLVGRYRPDLFTELRSVKLTAGKYQDVRSCCSRVTEVLDQVDANGNILRELSGSKQSKTKVKRIWKKPSCLNRPADGYVVENVALDRALQGRFIVDPPVPCDVDAYVLLKCVTDPCPLDETMQNKSLNGECVYNVAAWHYVLATMLAGDRFDNGNSKDQQYHYRMFFDILGVVKKAEEEATT